MMVACPAGHTYKAIIQKMINLPTFFMAAVVSVLAATPVDAPSAHRELRLGLEAHLDGKDSAALKHFAKCLKLADPAGDDADSCKIYSETFGKGKAKGDGASEPGAREAYKAAVSQYKKRDYVGADKNWHKCLDLSETGTSVRYDCMAAIDLLPKRLPEPEEVPARTTFMEGMIFYQKGENDKAAESWSRCAAAAPKDSDTEKDCRMGQAKLKKP